jgi:CRISPR-associated protein Csm1
MTSILEFIDNNKKTAEFHNPLSKLSLANTFPCKQFENDPDYKSLWEEFIQEFKFIQADTYHAFSETFQYLLQKYTTCIPASTINFPDVSLYDHLKTTAALAVCLYDYNLETAEIREKNKNEFLLIGGDFSGIQNYIYEIVSKQANKNLKGRSFYIRLLSDTVVRYLLSHLRLFNANVIYNSGGSFYILAPNTSFVRNELSIAIKNIERHFFKAHKTSLYVAIDSIGLSKNELMHQGARTLRDVWADLFTKREQQKQAKFANLLLSNYSNFFDPINEGGSNKRDVITGEEIPSDEKAYPLDEDKAQYISSLNKKQIQLGKVLGRSKYMIIAEEPIPYWENDKIVHLNPAELNLYYYFLNDKDLKEKKEQLKSSADKVSVISINEFNFIQADINGLNNIYGFMLYGGNNFNEKTFEEMSKRGEVELSRLGVLRMDVDNLGHIFQNGITPERSTLSRYASLSRSLDYFFSGYLNTIYKEVSPLHSFIVYSGGDDVFIVGSWEVTIEIAKRVREDFRDYSCQNKAFSISGGIALLSPKYPIMKGAQESEVEEKNAKSHTCKQFKKNSISFMDTALNWDYEFNIVESLKDEIVNRNYDESLSKSFISKVLMHSASAGFKEHHITNIKTYWMLTYDLSRMKQRIKHPETKALIEKCILEVCNNKKTLNSQEIITEYHSLELWTFACRWAELEMRTYKQ